jgi:hypothetical protein
MRHFHAGDRTRYAVGAGASQPGLSVHSVAWIRDHDVAGAVTDTYAYEAFPPSRPDWADCLAVHLLHIRDMGLIQGQNWDLEALSEACAEEGRGDVLLVAAPEPLAKAATDALPLRLDIVPAGARADRVRLTLGELLALQFARSGPPAAMRIERGAIRIGEASDADIVLPERGVRAAVNLPRLNVDRWSPLLSGVGRDAAAAGAAASALPDLIAARIGELVIAGRPIANLVLGATRAPEGDDTVWVANIVSDHATGSATWRMPRADNPGRVSARLVRLAVPEASRTDFADVLDATPADVPEFDVVAESFEVGARKLGRLELVALNAGGGAAAVWELQRLEISNADARMRATGRWVREAGATARTMALDLALEFSDAGKLLARLGIPDAVRGGEGTLSGRVSWRGAPLAIWNTDGLDGLYSIRLLLTRADNSVDSGVVLVTVDNTAPTIVLTTTEPGRVYRFPTDSTIGVTAEVSDNLQISRVEFYHEGTFLGADTSWPYSFDWTIQRPGSERFRAVVIDAVGNTAEAELTVEVLRSGA